ncbi:MAG TPA: TIGR04053 family radical SAM/SPASM domain-containing protein [Actinomycetota bacterium]|nr:TIGR04053 family radical SAM/SPASM domain-containing protein [Actinomycetota bacterium]
MTPTLIRRVPYDLGRRPFIVIWEVTAACDLACRHCRAEAVRERHPRELTTEEGVALLRQLTTFGPPGPLLVLSGGDPFKRRDLVELVRHGGHIGLPVAVAPSGTPLLTRRNLERLRAAGAVALSLSLDGSTASVHDNFRGVHGSYRCTLSAARAARELGFRLQLNTTVTAENLLDLPDLLALVRTLDPMTWSLFFLVPTGRARALPGLSPTDVEDVLNFLYDAGGLVPIKTTEAPEYRRVVIQRAILERRGVAPERVLALGETYQRLRARMREVLGEGSSTRVRVRRPPLEVSAGRGFAFVSRLGDVTPSGLLPLAAGNVRDRPLVDIYRGSALFRMLRDPDRLKGRCRRCEFRRVCGGSRARAYAVTGDVLGEDPACAYAPGSFPFQRELRAFTTP